MNFEQNEVVRIDPATDPAIQEYLDCFATDPAVHLEIEQLLVDAANRNNIGTPQTLDQLKELTTLYKSTTDPQIKKLIRHSQQYAFLTILEHVRSTKKESM